MTPDNAIASLESSSDFWGLLVLVCTLAVVIGLILEYVPLLIEWKRERKLSWEKWCEFAGAVLITLGVGGEFWFGGKQSKAQVDLRAANETVVAALNSRTAAAEKEAARLGVTVNTLPDFVAQKEGEISGQINAFNGFTSDELSKLQSDTDRLESMRKESEKALSDATHLLESEQSALGALKQAVAWRVVTNESAASMKRVLEGGSGSITLEYLAADPESTFLAIQLSKVFDLVNTPTKKWTINPVPRIDTDRVIFDVHVFGTGEKPIAVVRSALTAANIPFTGEEIPLMNFRLGGIGLGASSRDTDVVIVIGSRRPNF